MNKNDVKRILMSLRNNNNQVLINNLLGKIDLLSEEQLQQMISQFGDEENSIKKYFIEKLKAYCQHTNYSNVEKEKRESRTFSQIKAVLDKVLKLVKERKLDIYIAGGIVPYLLLNQDSNRLHDDIDTICKLEDIEQLKELFTQKGLYNPDWDSKNHTKDGKDYGFEMMVDGVPVGIYPFEYKDGSIIQYSFDPYNKACKMKTIPIEQLSDYIYTYVSNDGETYDTMSLEYIKLSKDYAARPKDKYDSDNISRCKCYRNDVANRLHMYTEEIK